MSAHDWIFTEMSDGEFCRICGVSEAHKRAKMVCPGDEPEPLGAAIAAAGLEPHDRISFWPNLIGGLNAGWRAKWSTSRLGPDVLEYMTDLHPDPESAIRAALDAFKKAKETT